MCDLDKEIINLKSEAVNLLDSMFNIPEGYSSMATKRIVECIVSAALLEVANLNKQAVNTGVLRPLPEHVEPSEPWPRKERGRK